jgi:type IV protein arginine methyltransferase
MKELGWDKKEGVRIVFGRWQDVLPELEIYDGIMFDSMFFNIPLFCSRVDSLYIAFAESDDDLAEFHEHLLDLLRPEGIYTFFNGLAATNPFFHGI